MPGKNKNNNEFVLGKEEIEFLLEKNDSEIMSIEEDIKPKLLRLEILRKRNNQYKTELRRFDKSAVYTFTPVLQDIDDNSERLYNINWTWLQKAIYILEDFDGGLTVNEIVEFLLKIDSSFTTDNARIGITNALNRRTGIDIEKIKAANKSYTYKLNEKSRISDF